MKVIYVAGPYTAESEFEKTLNKASAAKVGIECVKKGWSPIIPHINTGGFDSVKISDDDNTFWYEATMELMRRSDAIVLCSGWSGSSGTISEIVEANNLGIPVYSDVDELPSSSEFNQWSE